MDLLGSALLAVSCGGSTSASLEAPAPAKRRPVLVVSSDAFDRSRIRTVVCVAITSNLRLAEAPGNVLITSGKTGLRKDSVADVSQVVTLDKDDCQDHSEELTRPPCGRSRLVCAESSNCPERRRGCA